MNSVQLSRSSRRTARPRSVAARMIHGPALRRIAQDAGHEEGGERQLGQRERGGPRHRREREQRARRQHDRDVAAWPHLSQHTRGGLKPYDAGRTGWVSVEPPGTV